MNRLDYDQKALCRKVGNIFELSTICGYYPLSFAHAWCLSETANNIYMLDISKICQSKHYLMHDIQSEPAITGYLGDMTYTNQSDKDMMFWLGYIITYASFALHMSPSNLYDTYDIPAFAASYDVLHTLSNNRMVDEMKNEYNKVENVKENLFGNKT